MAKKITIIVLIIVAITILIGLTRQIISALDDGKRLDAAADTVSKLQQENQALRKNLAQAQDYDSIEEISRNDLNMSRTNETVVIIPQTLIDKVLESEKPKSPEPKTPNWQGWMKLFLRT